MAILIIGYKGRLGQEIYKQNAGKLKLIGVDTECDITDKHKFLEFVKNLQKSNNIDLVVHCAAYTKTDMAETEKALCYDINVNGTRNVVAACRASFLPLVYISTDYVFDGEVGGYKEDDIPNPINFYALTKLLGEIVVREYHYKSIVVRTSFKPNIWQYLGAYDDSYTTADYVSEIAKELLLLMDNFENLYGDKRCFKESENIFHIGKNRKWTVFELAVMKNPLVKPISRLCSNYKVPKDVSLNTEKWQQFKKGVTE